MSSVEPPSTKPLEQGTEKPRSWLEKLFAGFAQEPKSREELLDIIKGAAHNKVVDQEALSIIEGALDVAYKQVREIMIPRAQMVMLKSDQQPQEFIPTVIETGHSRFPVVGESTDDIKGILLAKDLLPLILKDSKEVDWESVLRPATIIPESKRLNVLLKEFRENRYHMALVIDEYGSISGLVTIEDILEEIVGEIEDETDEEGEDMIRQVAENDFIIKALTPIEDFNAYFDSEISDEEFDTIGGIIMQAFGHMPGRNEKVKTHGYSFRVLYSDSRKIHLLRVKRLEKKSK